MASPLLDIAGHGTIRLAVDLIFTFFILMSSISLSQITSDTHGQWKRRNYIQHILTKRQMPGPPMGGGMGGPPGSGPPSGMPMPMHYGPSGASGGPMGMGPHGSPQFMGPPGMQHEFSCVGRLPRLYQDPWMCTRYYWCNYGSPPVPFTCPQGQLFDQELQTCTMAMAVECRDFPEPLDALDMPAGGIGYHTPFGMNASPFSPAAPGGAMPPPNALPLPVATMSPMVPPAGAGNPPILPGNSNNGMGNPPMGGGSGSNGLNGLNGNQPALLQAGSMLPNGVNLNQFAQAVLSANSQNSAAKQGFLRVDNQRNNMANGGSPNDGIGCEAGKLGLFADVSKMCQTYFFCSPDGSKYEFQCPSHLQFSDQVKTCQNPEQVVCMDTMTFTADAAPQVINGFAMNNLQRTNRGLQGVIAPNGEAVALRYANPQMNAVYGASAAKKQQMINSMPDFSGSGSSMYPSFASSSGQSFGYSPYSISPRTVMTNHPTMMAASSPAAYGSMPYPQSGGAVYGGYGSQMPHHVTQRSMGAANSVPHYNVGYPSHASGEGGPYSSPYYPNSGAGYPNGGATRAVMSAEPQIEGAGTYPSQMTNSYYPGQGGLPQQYPSGPGGAGMAGGYPAGGPHHGHSVAMSGMSNMPMHGGHRGRFRAPIDPEAEVEAGRAHETPPATPAAAGAQGVPAGLNTFPGGSSAGAQMGPMMMEPGLVPTHSSVPDSANNTVVFAVEREPSVSSTIQSVGQQAAVPSKGGGFPNWDPGVTIVENKYGYSFNSNKLADPNDVVLVGLNKGKAVFQMRLDGRRKSVGRQIVTKYFGTYP